MSETAYEFEQRVWTRALELRRGQSEYFNMASTITLVRQAFSMGLDVVRAGPSSTLLLDRSAQKGEPKCQDP